MRKTLGLVLGLLCCLLLGGCMEAQELKERTIIETVGIDKKDGEFLVTMQNFSPEQQGNSKDVATGTDKTRVVQTTGITISQAVDKVTHYHGNEVFLGNSSFIIVGKKAAEEGLEEVLSFFNSNNEISPEICVVMAEESAEEIIRSQGSQGGISTAQVKNIVQQGRKNGILGRPTLRDVLNRLKSDCAEPYLPIMKVVKNGPNQIQIKLSGMAIFKGGKLKDELNVEDTRGVLWATNEIEHSLLAVPFGENNEGIASVKILKSSSKMRVTLEDGWPVLHLKIRSEAGLMEVNRPDGYGAGLEEIKEIEARVEQQVEQSVRNTIDKVFYGDKSDVFRYSEFIKKDQPTFWKAHQKEWDTVIGHCKFVYDIQCDLDRPGLEAKYQSINK